MLDADALRLCEDSEQEAVEKSIATYCDAPCLIGGNTSHEFYQRQSVKRRQIWPHTPGRGVHA
jgi:hypothetical protein